MLKSRFYSISNALQRYFKNMNMAKNIGKLLKFFSQRLILNQLLELSQRAISGLFGRFPPLFLIKHAIFLSFSA